MKCQRRIDLYVSGWTSLVFGSLVYRVLPTQPIETIDDYQMLILEFNLAKSFPKKSSVFPSSHLLLFIANCPEKEGQRRSGMMKSQSPSLPNFPTAARKHLKACSENAVRKGRSWFWRKMIRWFRKTRTLCSGRSGFRPLRINNRENRKKGSDSLSRLSVSVK